MAPVSRSFASINYIRDQLAQRSQSSHHNPAAVTVRTIVKRAETDQLISLPTPLPTPTPKDPAWVPGQGIHHPQSINNKGYFALFALLGVAIVIASIWFFFWAKNGGFTWKKTDWDDYKSTVLRRKGKDGKTLSNATKTTDLGQKSIAGTFDIDRREEMTEKFGHDQKPYRDHEDRYTRRPGGNRKREPSDEDLRAYRHEKPARVGGLNREHDGSHFDFSSTDRSDVSNNSRTHLVSKDDKKNKNKKGLKEKVQKAKNAVRDQAKSAAKNAHGSHDTPPPVPAHSSLGSEVEYSDDYRRPTPNFANDRHGSSRHRSPHRHSAGMPARSGRATHRPHPHAHRESVPGSWDAAGSEISSSDSGTKIYEHHIPGLSGRPAQQGFRRGQYDDSEL